jgi:hypothetical protein
LDYAPPSRVLDAIERQPSDCPLDPAPVSSAYNADIAGAILDQLADGRTLADICQQAGYPRAATVRRWAVDDVAGFAARYQQALELQADAWSDELVQIADGADDADTTRDRLRIETRQFLMRVRNRSTYDPPKQTATTDALDWLAVLQAAGLAAQPSTPAIVQGVVIEHDAAQASATAPQQMGPLPQLPGDTGFSPESHERG